MHVFPPICSVVPGHRSRCRTFYEKAVQRVNPELWSETGEGQSRYNRSIGARRVRSGTGDGVRDGDGIRRRCKCEYKGKPMVWVHGNSVRNWNTGRKVGGNPLFLMVIFLFIFCLRTNISKGPWS